MKVIQKVPLEGFCQGREDKKCLRTPFSSFSFSKLETCGSLPARGSMSDFYGGGGYDGGGYDGGGGFVAGTQAASQGGEEQRLMAELAAAEFELEQEQAVVADMKMEVGVPEELRETAEHKLRAATALRLLNQLIAQPFA